MGKESKLEGTEAESQELLVDEGDESPPEVGTAATAEEGKANKAKAKKDKKANKKKVQAKSTTEFEGNTTDAALLSASRLTHVPDGKLHPDDALGYVYHICLHFISMSLIAIFCYIWFVFLETMEDPWERTSITVMKKAVQRAIAEQLPLSNYSYLPPEDRLYWPPPNLTFYEKQFVDPELWNYTFEDVIAQSNFTEYDEIRASYALGHCVLVRHDLFYMHMALLGIFCALIVDRCFAAAQRLWVIVRLPKDSHFGWDGYEDTEYATDHDASTHVEDEKIMHYSLRNWDPDDNDIDHMPWPLKIISIVFIILPDILFTLFAFWTGAKLFATRMGNPVKLIKSALKVSFLLKFPNKYYEYFASHNMRVMMLGGEFWIPKTKVEQDDEDAAKQAAEDEEEPNHEPGFMDHWGAWLSCVTKIILGYAMAALLMMSVWGYVYDFRNLCKRYELGLQEGVGWGWGSGLDSYWESEGWSSFRDQTNRSNFLETIFW